MHNPRWSLFFDFHTMPAVPDVGAGFDVERFTDRVKACGVDYMIFPARCNLGMAYYNTKVGIRHPSLQYDLFGRLAEACQRKEIALTAYINAGLSHEEALLHRDWATLTPEGYAYTPIASVTGSVRCATTRPTATTCWRWSGKSSASTPWRACFSIV